MARRRLNKKVALMGSTVFLILAMLGVVVILRLTRDPAQFIADGDAAWAACDYESARRNYLEALNRTPASEDQIELYFKLADVYRVTDDWRRVLACWEQIITSNPANVRARMARLKYIYIMADSLGRVGQSVGAYWEDVASQANELLPIAREAALLEAEKSPYEPSFEEAEPTAWDGGIARIGAYLYFVQGRAALELARLGVGVDPDELLARAQAHLHEAGRLDPENDTIHRHMAAAFREEARVAESRGHHDRSAQAARRADALLSETSVVGPGPQIGRLDARLAQAKTSTLALARDQMKELEGDYRALVDDFPTSAEAFLAAAEFYSLCSAYLPTDAAKEKLDLAIEAAEKARDLDPTNVRTVRLAAGLYYRRFTLYGDQPALHKAIALAEAALDLPDARDTPGPRQYAAQVVRFSLCTLLGRFYLEQMVQSGGVTPTDPAVLARAEAVVHEIEQIQGSGENPQVVKWRGMLALAKGQTAQAVRDLHAAYEQMRGAAGAGEGGDAFLSHTLAKLFENTSETGAAIEFLGAALNAGIVNTRPETVLDYGDALLRVRSYDVALSAVNSFEERFGATARSRRLRAQTLLAKGHISEAEEAVEQLDANDPETLRLRLVLVSARASQLQEALQRSTSAMDAARDGDAGGRPEATQAMQADLHACRRRQADMMQRLLGADATVVDGRSLESLCEILIGQGDAALARTLVEAFLQRFPQDVAAMFCRGLLSEPDPSACPEARRRALRLGATRSLNDPVARAAELGLFHERDGDLDEAKTQWQKVVDATVAPADSDRPIYLRAESPNRRHQAVGRLFEIARQQEDWAGAEKLVAVARADDLDDCGGQLFAGRLAFARGRHAEALNYLDECLKQRPVFSYGYMVRSGVHAAVGNAHACLADARRASSLNPVDPLVARTLANAMLVRNRDLGRRASAEQRNEALLALERAIHLNPRDTQMLLVYAGLLDDSDPVKALGIRQTIQIAAPSLENAVTLGRLATRIAVGETDPARKAGFVSIAATAFEQARQIDPDSEFMLQSYAEHYRLTGRPDKAAQLLVESRDDRLLWRHHYRNGHYEQARTLLQRLYDDPTARNDALIGLVLVAQATGDREAIRRHSDELIRREDNAANRMAQVRAFLEAGLIQEAERKLQSFKERHPGQTRLLLIEALLAKRQGHLEQALDLTNRHLEQNQQDAAGWRLRGEIARLRGDYDQAIGDFRKSRLLDDDPDTTVALAHAYLWAGRHDEAVSELRAVVRTPSPPAAARPLLERTYRRLGQLDALEQFYAETVTQLPDSVPWLLRAGAFAIDRRDTEKALDLYGKAYRLRRDQTSHPGPGDAPFAAVLDGYLHAMILSAAEPAGGGPWQPERLERLFQESENYLDTEYAPLVLCRMAEARKKLGDVDEARRLCHQAVEKTWDNDRLSLAILRRVRLLMGDEEIGRSCRDWLVSDPRSLAANATMLRLARVRGDYDEAVDWADKCIALSDSDPRRVIAYMLEKADLLTAAYEHTSDKRYLRTAGAVYESLAKKMPTNGNVLNNLAYVLARNDERLDEARQHVERALAQDPDNAAYLDTYAFVLHRQGNDAAAARSIAAAIQHYETAGVASATAYEHLGMILEGLDDRKGALAAYRRALAAADGEPSDPLSRRIGSAVERLQADQ